MAGDTIVGDQGFSSLDIASLLESREFFLSDPSSGASGDFSAALASADAVFVCHI